MIPATNHASSSPLGASALASDHGEGRFDPAIRIGVNEDKVVVMNPGIDPAKSLDQKSLDKVESLLKVKSPRLITVSRFDKRKNHEKVIMALRNLKQIYPDIVYICIGSGDDQ